MGCIAFPRGGVARTSPPGLVRCWTASGGLPVIDLDRAAAEEAGRFRAMREAAGLASSASDMLIAATAATLGATLATRNVRDFTELPVPVENPWA